MPFIPKRPLSLKHLSDEQAARCLSRHFGDVVKTAEALGVDRRDLRKLTWHNPKILDASHERQELFILMRRSELMDGLMSKVSRIRWRAADQLFGNPVLREPFAGAGSSLDLLTPAPRGRRPRGSNIFVEAERARLAIEREVAAERDVERAAEQAAERERELVLERERDMEREEGSQAATLPRPQTAAPASPVSLRPLSRIRRPSRWRGW